MSAEARTTPAPQARARGVAREPERVCARRRTRGDEVPHQESFTHEKDAIRIVIHGIETAPLVLGAAIDLAAAAATWSPA